LTDVDYFGKKIFVKHIVASFFSKKYNDLQIFPFLSDDIADLTAYKLTRKRELEMVFFVVVLSSSLVFCLSLLYLFQSNEYAQ